MHKPTAGTLLTGFIFAFVSAVVWPLIPFFVAWAAWKVYRYCYPAVPPEVRHSIQARQARQIAAYAVPYPHPHQEWADQTLVMPPVQPYQPALTAAQRAEVEQAIAGFLASAERYEQHARHRRVPRDRP